MGRSQERSIVPAADGPVSRKVHRSGSRWAGLKKGPSFRQQMGWSEERSIVPAAATFILKKVHRSGSSYIHLKKGRRLNPGEGHRLDPEIGHRLTREFLTFVGPSAGKYMKIDNQKNIYRIWLRKMVFTIVFTAAILVIVFINIFDQPGAPITKYHLVIAVSLVFIIISIIGYLRKPCYFYFDDINDVLVFRYYPVGMFNSRKNSIQIPKQHFVKFETEKFFLGMEEKLILHQRYRKKVAKYKPISLSAVDKADREKLKAALIHYSSQK